MPSEVMIYRGRPSATFSKKKQETDSSDDMTREAQSQTYMLISWAQLQLRIYFSFFRLYLTNVSKRHLLKSYWLRTFARKCSNIDFFLRILPLQVDELVMSEM